MFRTPLVAALTAALLGGTAMAQPASAPPAHLPNSARPAPDLDEADDGYAPGLGNMKGAQVNAQRDADARARDARSQPPDRDMFCRRDAAARTGYTTPGEAAHDEQTRGTVGGTVGGAVLGTILGAAAGNAGLGAAAGAGAGLIAGSAIGADNARHAARNVAADYDAAYYDCMHEDTRQAAYYDGPPPAYGYGPPPPPPVYYYSAPVYYPYPYYYGPSVSFGFGFGGGHGWGHRGWYGGGWRHH